MHIAMSHIMGGLCIMVTCGNLIVCVPAKCACMNMGSCGRVCSVMYAEAHAIWTSNTEASTC